MERKILKAISTIDQLNVEELNSLDIGVEIQDLVEPNLSSEDIEKLIHRYKEKFKGFNNIKALHGPFLDLKPSSPDEKIREVSHFRYLYTIKAAKELEIDYLIFHSQINPYLNKPSLARLNNMQAREFWLKLLEEVPDYKGIILLENVFEETPDMLKELIETINLPNIKINLDMGHAKLGRVPLEEWIRELRDYIFYMHIHSNDGEYDVHQRPSEEEIEHLYYLLDKYAINPVLSLEYKVDDTKEEIIRYKRRIR